MAIYCVGSISRRTFYSYFNDFYTCNINLLNRYLNKHQTALQKETAGKRCLYTKNIKTMIKITSIFAILIVGLFMLCGCNNVQEEKPTTEKDTVASQTETPDYFLLRPELEKKYGYSHAVKIGDHLKISGA